MRVVAEAGNTNNSTVVILSGVGTAVECYFVELLYTAGCPTRTTTRESAVPRRGGERFGCLTGRNDRYPDVVGEERSGFPAAVTARHSPG